jgi:uncharacterized RDD family membrane protein YckC
MSEPATDDLAAAPWTAHIGAWLVDLLLLGALITVFGDLLNVGTGLVTLSNPLEMGQHTILLFAYWTLFEANTGQSPGKMALELEVVAEDGHPPDFLPAAVQAFGKAFLLPLDVLIGLLAMPGEGQRLFNRLSGTRVVRLPDDGRNRRGPTAADA